MVNVLLTGGSGFIGRNIRESYLTKQYNIFAPSHAELELMDEAAVRDYLLRHKIEVIIHAAAKPGHRNAKDPTGIFYHNTRIFFNLARNDDIFRKMIVTGSGAVYDMRYYQPEMQEDYAGMHVPVDEHGLSKYVIDKYIHKSNNIIDLRIFGIFGKYEDYAIRFISNMICKTLFDLPLTIKQNKRFDYIYVNDLMPVLEYFIVNEAKYKAYNVTPNESIELVKLAQMVLNISGKKLPIVVASDGMGLEYSGNNSRLKKEMACLHFTPLEHAIGDLFMWYVDNIHTIQKDALLVDK